MEEYRELLQFSLYVSNIKNKEIKRKNGKKKCDEKCIKGIWINSGSHGKYILGVKHCTFDEYVNLVRTGHTVRRIRCLNGVVYPTRFLFLDFDNTLGENISENEIRQLESEKVRVLPSSSGNPYKWHVYVFTDELCDTLTDLERESRKIIDKLREICRREISFDDNTIHNWHLVCYGMPQMAEFSLDIPEGVEFFTPQILKDGVIRKKFDTYEDWLNSQVVKKKYGNARIVPYNSRMLLEVLQDQKYLLDKSFSIYPPSSYKNRLIKRGITNWKISEGRRYHVAQCWTIKLVSQWYKCNLKYGLEYTFNDLEYTLRCLCKMNFASYEEFNMEGIINGLKREVKSKANLTYEQIESMSEGQIRIYRDRHRIEEILLELKGEYLFNSDTILFPTREDMLKALENYHISLKTVKRHLNVEGFDIDYVKKTRSDRGKSKIDFSKYEQDDEGRYLIPASEITQYLRNVASKQRLKIKSVK